MGCCCWFGFFHTSSADPRDFHSFPTRRSSDLAVDLARGERGPLGLGRRRRGRRRRCCRLGGTTLGLGPHRLGRPLARPREIEEHTSELQSHSELVCRLLLEKKKKRHAAATLPQ